MMQFIKLGFRNVLRNKRRSFLTSLAIAFGLCALIVGDGFTEGLKRASVKAATGSFIGEAQIHRAGFLGAVDVNQTLHHLSDLEARLAVDKRVKSVAVRGQSLVMISSVMTAGHVRLYGIDPLREREISKLSKRVIAGTDQLSEYGILIGDRLARILDVGLGDRLVVTAAEAGTGALVQELFIVEGLYRFGSRAVDASLGFIDLEKFRKIFQLGNRAHEIALTFQNPLLDGDKDSTFWRDYTDSQNEILSWRAIATSIYAATQASDFFAWIMGGILLILVALGIINTLFMSLYERMFEFGVLRAIGTNTRQIIVMILAEAAVIGGFSIFCGMLLALIFNGYLAIYGIHFGVEVGVVILDEPVYNVFRSAQFIGMPCVVFVVVLLAALYPAFYATRITAISAMKVEG
ncbi:MAG: ABC transporter permease [Alphaproteobacteria bacterium]